MCIRDSLSSSWTGTRAHPLTRNGSKKMAQMFNILFKTNHCLFTEHAYLMSYGDDKHKFHTTVRELSRKIYHRRSSSESRTAALFWIYRANYFRSQLFGAYILGVVPRAPPGRFLRQITNYSRCSPRLCAYLPLQPARKIMLPHSYFINNHLLSFFLEIILLYRTVFFWMPRSAPDFAYPPHFVTCRGRAPESRLNRSSLEGLRDKFFFRDLFFH